MKAIIHSSLTQIYFSMTKAAYTQEHNLHKVWTKALCSVAGFINLSAHTGDPPGQSK